MKLLQAILNILWFKHCEWKQLRYEYQQTDLANTLAAYTAYDAEIKRLEALGLNPSDNPDDFDMAADVFDEYF